MAAKAQTSDSMLPGVSSSSTSGADHGIESPTASSSREAVNVEAIPKSDSTGWP